MKKKAYIAPQSALITMSLHVMLGVDSNPASGAPIQTRYYNYVEEGFEDEEEYDTPSGYWK